ncbi:hypothetical protein O3297_04970 [Janthinobacterium sp. SUN128]|uniref:hypothetical protein n=1 Tax=Janthinobacterium sp. SUN128 TaxID=3014790 RepID=UPI002714085C|nr:hypothetical protein [Janthinobacterium sp. SUN128]MDO8032752.1 hypothetical protein [Janthinobacterium sp. SUN128]
MFFTILLPKNLLAWLSNSVIVPAWGTGIAHELPVQASPLCTAAVQYSAIGSIYFAVLSVSLQFIVIINCNSKYTWEQYYRPLCINSQIPQSTSQVSVADIGAIIAMHEPQILLNQKDKRRTTAYKPESAHSIA